MVFKAAGSCVCAQDDGGGRCPAKTPDTALHFVPAVRQTGSEMVSMPAAVYILASDRNGTIYTGVTSNLAKRITQHKTDEVESFTKKYRVHKLVWYEYQNDIVTAIEAEKKIKNRDRKFKTDLIERENPYWNDLSGEVTG